MVRKLIVGIDEAGRGPLAGPITVAAVATTVNPKFQSASRRTNYKLLSGIKDSKKLSPKQRDEWFKKIKTRSDFLTAHSSVGNRAIDKIGIVKATSRAVKNCLKKLNSKYLILNTKCLLLLDGALYAPAEYQDQQTIIKGDEKIPIIAAASIIAKVTRDRKMTRLAKKYPKYSFEIHKGYGTKAHGDAIKKHGICAIHRKSFCSRLL